MDGSKKSDDDDVEEDRRSVRIECHCRGMTRPSGARHTRQVAARVPRREPSAAERELK